MTIATLQQLKDASAAPMLEVMKLIGGSSNSLQSSWSFSGFPPAGATPSSGVAGDIPTKATTGALWYPSAEAGEENLIAYIDALESISAGFVLVYDRIWHNSGLVASSTSAQAVGSVALPDRANGGVGIELWLDQYSAMSTAAPATTVSYTNPEGTAGRTATLLNSVPTASGNCAPFGLDAGDVGIKSIASFTQVSSRTSGTFGLVLRRRLAMIPVSTFTGPTKLDWMSTMLQKIADDACIEFIHWGTATTQALYAHIQLAQG